MKVIEKYALGGVQATFVPQTYTQTAALSAGKSDDSDSSKKGKSMFEEQMQQFGGVAGKILPSEMPFLLERMNKAADLSTSEAFQSLTKPQQYMLQLNEYFNALNAFQRHKEDLEKAKERLISKDGTGEIAITNEGYVFVHKDGEEKVSLVTVKQFNPKKDIPVTNAELTNLRANDVRYAGNDKITTTLLEATSMKEIREVILQSTQRLNTQSLSTEQYINPFSENDPKLIAALRDINITSEDLKTMDLGTLIKVKTQNKSNAGAIERAIRAIYGQLTRQQKTLLEVRAKEMGNAIDPRGLVFEFLASMVNDEHSVSLDITNTFTAGNAELRAQRAEDRAEKRQIRKEERDAARKAQEEKVKAQEGAFDKTQIPGVVRFVVGMSAHDSIEITNGAKGKFVAYGASADVTSGGKPIGFTDLDNLVKSDFAGSLDEHNITMGGKKIEPYKQSHVLVDGSNIVKAALLVDQNALRQNIIKPDIDACQRLDDAWTQLKSMGITKETILQAQTEEERRAILNKINEVIQGHQLPLMFYGLNEQGMPVLNLTSYREFAVMNGYADGKALPEGGKWEEQLLPIGEEDAVDIERKFRELAMDHKYQAPRKYGTFDLRRIFSNPRDLYEGAIFIPVNDDINSALSTAGNSFQPKVPESIEIARRQYQNNKVGQTGYSSNTVQEEVVY